MSCGCSNSTYCQTCCPEIPYPQISHESVPSLIDNLVNALYGTITKSIVNGRVKWNIPCDPNNSASAPQLPREAGEGLLCYIMRYFDTINPFLIKDRLIYSDTMPEGYSGLEWVDTTTMKRYEWYSNAWIESFGGNNGVTTGGGTGGTNITVSSIQPSPANEGDMWTNLDTYIQFQYISGIWVQV